MRLLFPIAFAILIAACDADTFTVPSASVLVGSTDRMDFGPVTVALSAERKIRLTNPGGHSLSILAVTVDQALGAFTVRDYPRTLAQGASGELTVAFTPGVVGPHDGVLTIVTDTERSPTLRIELAGVGVQSAANDGGVTDTGLELDDGGGPDAGPPIDAAAPDSAVIADSSVIADSGVAPDTGVGPGSWTPTSLNGAPTARDLHGAVWTGTQMIIFGARGGAGLTNGARYDPTTDSWSSMASAGAPSFHSWGQNGPTLVWTGAEVVAWNGYVSGAPRGGRYDPATNSWRTMSTTDQPGPRRLYPAVWTGAELIVWGGCDQLSTAFPDGARYDPALDRWTPMSSVGAPAARCAHTAVWTGTEMIVWGGLASGGTDLATGGRYDPATNSWAPISNSGAPSARRSSSGVWTGTELIVFGGSPDNASGGRYRPATDTWTPLPAADAPSPRQNHTAVWTGTQMIVWGGSDITSPGAADTGAAYDPASNRWTPTTLSGAPAGRYVHTAVWTGAEMIVWGGTDAPSGYFDTGGRYRP